MVWLSYSWWFCWVQRPVPIQHRSSAGQNHWSCSCLHQAGRRPCGLGREHYTGSHSGREEIMASLMYVPYFINPSCYSLCPWILGPESTKWNRHHLSVLLPLRDKGCWWFFSNMSKGIGFPRSSWVVHIKHSMKNLIQTMDKINKLPQITRVASSVASLRFPSNYVVGHIGKSLHVSYEATGISATMP